MCGGLQYNINTIVASKLEANDLYILFCRHQGNNVQVKYKSVLYFVFKWGLGI